VRSSGCISTGLRICCTITEDRLLRCVGSAKEQPVLVVESVMANGLDGHDSFWGKLRASVKAWAERLIGPRLARREDASDLAQNAMLSMFSEADLLTGLDPEPR